MIKQFYQIVREDAEHGRKLWHIRWLGRPPRDEDSAFYVQRSADKCVEVKLPHRYIYGGEQVEALRDVLIEIGELQNAEDAAIKARAESNRAAVEQKWRDVQANGLPPVDLSTGDGGVIRFRNGEMFFCICVEGSGDNYYVRIESGWSYRYKRDGTLLVTGRILHADGTSTVPGRSGPEEGRDIIFFDPSASAAGLSTQLTP